MHVLLVFPFIHLSLIGNLTMAGNLTLKCFYFYSLPFNKNACAFSISFYSFKFNW